MTVEQELEQLFHEKMQEDYDCPICGLRNCNCDEETDKLMEREREDNE